MHVRGPLNPTWRFFYPLSQVQLPWWCFMHWLIYLYIGVDDVPAVHVHERGNSLWGVKWNDGEWDKTRICHMWIHVLHDVYIVWMESSWSMNPKLEEKREMGHEWMLILLSGSVHVVCYVLVFISICGFQEMGGSSYRAQNLPLLFRLSLSENNLITLVGKMSVRP